jgi:quinol monooxygenase YgiN
MVWHYAASLLRRNAIMAITRINTFEAKSGQASELREFLSSVIALIVDAPGCRSVELLVGHDDPGHLAIVEMWDSVEAHQASVSRIPPNLFQKAQTLFGSPPVGSYYQSLFRQAVATRESRGELNARGKAT